MVCCGVVHKQFPFSFHLRAHLGCCGRKVWAASLPSLGLLVIHSYNGFHPRKKGYTGKGGVGQSSCRVNLQTQMCQRNQIISSPFGDVTTFIPSISLGGWFICFFLMLQEEHVVKHCSETWVCSMISHFFTYLYIAVSIYIYLYLYMYVHI